MFLARDRSHHAGILLAVRIAASFSDASGPEDSLMTTTFHVVSLPRSYDTAKAYSGFESLAFSAVLQMHCSSAARRFRFSIVPSFSSSGITSPGWASSGTDAFPPFITPFTSRPISDSRYYICQRSRKPKLRHETVKIAFLIQIPNQIMQLVPCSP
ncbi:hypothetical protein BDP67DRAFT_497476 [Colletotrichum lupini]|nr:hypothetical protein BDP67DRAFT_497476 [Colletotrichum lupini]